MVLSLPDVAPPSSKMLISSDPINVSKWLWSRQEQPFCPLISLADDRGPWEEAWNNISLFAWPLGVTLVMLLADPRVT